MNTVSAVALNLRDGRVVGQASPCGPCANAVRRHGSSRLARTAPVGRLHPHCPPPLVPQCRNWFWNSRAIRVRVIKIHCNLSFGLKSALPGRMNPLPRRPLSSSEFWYRGRLRGALLFGSLSGAFRPTLHMAALDTPPGGSRGPPHALGRERCGHPAPSLIVTRVPLVPPKCCSPGAFAAGAALTADPPAAGQRTADVNRPCMSM